MPPSTFFMVTYGLARFLLPSSTSLTRRFCSATSFNTVLLDFVLSCKLLLPNGPVTFLDSLARLSAASAAFLPASSSDDVFAFELPPSVLGGPPTFLCAGMGEVVWGAGAEERVRPGWEKGSFEDSLPQRAPIVYSEQKT